MEIIVSLVTSAVSIISITISIYTLYLLRRIDTQIKKELGEQKIAFIESGNAITDTLKIAFENIKKGSYKQTKTDSNISEHGSRLHRLEQQCNALMKMREKVVKLVTKNETPTVVEQPPKKNEYREHKTD